MDELGAFPNIKENEMTIQNSPAVTTNGRIRNPLRYKGLSYVGL